MNVTVVVLCIIVMTVCLHMCVIKNAQVLFHNFREFGGHKCLLKQTLWWKIHPYF